MRIAQQNPILRQMPPVALAFPAARFAQSHSAPGGRVASSQDDTVQAERSTTLLSGQDLLHTGGLIGSSQAAVERGKNSLTTATLTTSDIQNIDRYAASSIGVSLALSSQPKAPSKTPAEASPAAAAKFTASDPGSAGFTSVPGAGAGIGSASGNQSSTTKSGISGATISITNNAQQKALTGQDASATIASLAPGVTTSSATGALVKSWNGQQLKQEVDAQRDITQAFSQAAPKTVASYADSQLAEAAKLRGQAREESDPAKIAAFTQQANNLEANWKEGGMARVALHTAAGFASGGVAGAAGAAVTSAAAPKLDELQAGFQAALVKQGVGDAAAKVMAQGLAAGMALGIGAAVGGTGGAATGLTTDVNDRMLHYDEKDLIARKANGDKKAVERLTKAACLEVKCWSQFPEGSPRYKQNYVSPPDYVSAQGNFYVASDGFAVDLHNGETFGQWGSARAYPAFSITPGFSVNVGTLIGGGTAQSTSDFLKGGGMQANAYVPLIPVMTILNVGEGVNHSYGGRTSIEVGISSQPGVSVAPISYGFAAGEKLGEGK